MVHALLQVDCTAMCVGSACRQPSFNIKNPSSVFVLISNCIYIMFCIYIGETEFS